MQTMVSIPRLRKALARWRRSGLTVGLVPTMGFLHAGHMELAARARRRVDRVVLSIFVNPAQFGPGEDFQSYPRDPARDRRLCRAAGVDLVFLPSPRDMYAPDHSVYVNEDALAGTLCGASRPGHFRGVLTVVAKLFNLVQPDLAVFGQKDAQQERLIRRMTRDLDFPVRLLTAPIVREPDGLAMSSRNAYLNPRERHQALCLSNALKLARSLYRAGERDAGLIRRRMLACIRRARLARADYAAIVADPGLTPVAKIEGPVLLALAVYFGRTRLIDNLMLPDDRLSNLPD